MDICKEIDTAWQRHEEIAESFRGACAHPGVENKNIHARARYMQSVNYLEELLSPCGHWKKLSGYGYVASGYRFDGITEWKACFEGIVTKKVILRLFK